MVSLIYRIFQRVIQYVSVNHSGVDVCVAQLPLQGCYVLVMLVMVCGKRVPQLM